MDASHGSQGISQAQYAELLNLITMLQTRVGAAKSPAAGFSTSDGPVTLSDLLDTQLAGIAITPKTSGMLLLIGNANVQNAPMGSGPHSFFLLLADSVSGALHQHPTLNVASGESHAGIIQFEAGPYPVGTPVTLFFQGRASGGSGTDMTAVAIDFSVTERG